jgi:hypothetical protein
MRSSRIPPLDNRPILESAFDASVYQRLRKAQPCLLREKDGRNVGEIGAGEEIRTLDPDLGNVFSSSKLLLFIVLFCVYHAVAHPSPNNYLAIPPEPIR